MHQQNQSIEDSVIIFSIVGNPHYYILNYTQLDLVRKIVRIQGTIKKLILNFDAQAEISSQTTF